jgi:hypothetical protein
MTGILLPSLPSPILVRMSRFLWNRSARALHLEETRRGAHLINLQLLAHVRVPRRPGQTFAGVSRVGLVPNSAPDLQSLLARDSVSQSYTVVTLLIILSVSSPSNVQNVRDVLKSSFCGMLPPFPISRSEPLGSAVVLDVAVAREVVAGLVARVGNAARRLAACDSGSCRC